VRSRNDGPAGRKIELVDSEEATLRRVVICAHVVSLNELRSKKEGRERTVDENRTISVLKHVLPAGPVVSIMGGKYERATARGKCNTGLVDVRAREVL
jgi:hypothetical protein